MGKPLPFVQHDDGMSPTSGHHARDEMITYVSHGGGITPTFRHYVGKNHFVNGCHVGAGILCESSTQMKKGVFSQRVLRIGNYASLNPLYHIVLCISDYVAF